MIITLTLENYLDLTTVGNYATKPKESRPLLEGILLTNIEYKNNANATVKAIKATCTDSYRMAQVTRDAFISESINTGVIIPAIETVELLVPADLMLRAAKAFRASNKSYRAKGYASATEVNLKTDGNTITITCKDETLGGSLIPGNYPKVEQLIPAANGIHESSAIGLDPEFLADVAKIAPFSDKTKDSRSRAIKVAAINDNVKPVLFEDVSGLTRVVLMPVRMN